MVSRAGNKRAPSLLSQYECWRDADALYTLPLFCWYLCYYGVICVTLFGVTFFWFAKMPKRQKKTVLNSECREFVIRLRDYFELFLFYFI